MLHNEEDDYRNRRIEEIEEYETTRTLIEEERNEKRRLEEWREIRRRQILNELRIKKQNGTITEEELMRLKELEEWDWKNYKKSELDELRAKRERGE